MNSEPFHSMARREFLKTTAIVAAATVAGPGSDSLGRDADGSVRGSKLIDVNVSLSRWPCRRLPLDETTKLAAKLRSLGVVQAWAGSFDGLLHKDITAVNARLAEECRAHGRDLFVPFGSINLQRPGWEEELVRCRAKHKMPGIRLHPNYHGYKLNDAEFAECLRAAASVGLIVQIAVSMEDERVQHPSVRAADVDLTPLPGIMREIPSARVVLLNWFRAVKGELLGQLSATKRAWFDLAMVEGVGGIEKLVRAVPSERVLFGSHAPFFYPESAVLKLKESVLAPEEARMVTHGSARELIEGGKGKG